MKKIIFAVIFSFILGANFAFAHERQVVNVGGTDYLFTVGSLNEPIVVGDKTGIDLRIVIPDPKDIGNSSATNSKPVIGLEKTLKIENISGRVKKEFPLTATWGKVGNYQTVFYPSNSDTISYRIFGTINEKKIDLLFTCDKSGHVMSEMSGSNIHMKNGDFDVKFHAGSFGCPKEKEDFMFPLTSLKDRFGSNMFGIIALVLVLGLIIQNRKIKK